MDRSGCGEAGRRVNERLRRQIGFVREIDRLKSIFRQTLLMDGSRYENDAEHSCHVSVMAVLLSEYAVDGHMDVLTVIKMLLIHDLVEIHAGDTFCYDEKAAADQPQREKEAAARIFGLLPPGQGDEFKRLWETFEARETVEARFAAALDRLQPILHNFSTRGAAWKRHGVTVDQVMKRNRHIADGSPELWEFAQDLIREAVEKGYLAAGSETR
jgi:putative hydrolases of HD superfamily